MRVVVTGANGYIGGRLIPTLLEAGHEVVATFTDPAKASRFAWADQVRVVGMDIADFDQVRAAVAGADAVYYLIHGMAGEGFAERDRAGAANLARAAAAEQVGRVVYLSGIIPRVGEQELSEHLRSRKEVETILASSGVPTLTLRAAIVVGSASTSFEIIRQISERLPVQTIPTWMDAQVQPIAVSDVIAVLLACLEVASITRSYDIGGPQRLSYRELLDLYAEVAGLTRPQVLVPLLPTALVGRLAGLFTDVPTPTVTALMESLRHDMVCGDTEFLGQLLPADHQLLPLREAIERALADPDDSVDDAAHLDQANPDPLAAWPTDPDWTGGEKHEADYEKSTGR